MSKMNSNEEHEKPSEGLYPKIQLFTSDMVESSDSPELQISVPINSNHELTSPESNQGSTTNLYPLTTSHYTLPNRKGWKALSPLEKQLSMSLGVVSVLCVGLMIAVIVAGVKLSKENDCKLVSTTTSPVTQRTPGPPVSTSNPCETTDRPRPPRKQASATSSPLDSPNEVHARPRPQHQFAPAAAECISSEKYNNETICLTPACFQKAGRIIESMDFSMDPCDNFFEFACGNWIKNNPIPEDTQTWDQVRKLEEKQLREIKHILEDEQTAGDSRPFILARQFYHSCMYPQDDEVGLEDMKALLDITTNTNLDNDTDPLSSLAVMLGNIRRLLDGNYVISLEVDVDDKNTGENAIYLNHPTSGLASLLSLMDLEVASGLRKSNDRSGQGHWLVEKDEHEILTFYKDLIRKLWSLVFPQDAKNLETIVSALVHFETILTDASTMSSDMDDPEAMYNLLSEVNDTQLSPKMVAWLEEFVDEVFSETAVNGSGHVTAFRNESEERVAIIVKDVKYLRNLEMILNETARETIENYVKLRILLQLGPQGGHAFQELFTQFKKKVLKRDFCTSRWETCARQTNELFGWAISAQYILAVVDFSTKNQLNQTANYLKAALTETLDGVDWIGSIDTRLYAQDKLELMQTYLGFPEWGSRNSFVESFYSNMNFTDPSNYFQNYVETIIWLSHKRLAEIFEPSVEAADQGWPKYDPPTHSKPRYSQKSNYLGLPAGAIDWIQSSMNDLFPSVHYGSLGMAMAENMLRGVIVEGRYHGVDGELISWWDNETTKNYLNLAQCFRDQYHKDVLEGNSNAQLINLVHGKPKAEDNMLSSGALSISYLAYHSHSFHQKFNELLLPGLQDYTPEQLFFLSYAQSQCSSVPRHANLSVVNLNPGVIRVRSTLQNSVEFAKHWNCDHPKKADVCRVF